MSRAKAIAIVDYRPDALRLSALLLGASVILVNLVSLIGGVVVPLIMER